MPAEADHLQRRTTARRPTRICAIGLRGIPDVMGGIEAHCENLYARLAALDETMEFTVIGRSRYVRAGTVKGVRVIPLWAPRLAKLETLIHTPLAILYARLFLHPDIIHLHALGPGFFTPLARLLGFRVVATHHAADYKRSKFGPLGRWFLKAGEGAVARFADRVVCVSSIIEKQLAKEHPARRRCFTTIRNGAPPAASAGATVETQALLASLGLEKQKYVLCVGRLDPAKGFHDAADAFKLARPKDLKLVIVGGSIGSDAYAAKLKLSAPSTVVFAGPRSPADLQILYSNAALFVHPSHHEGFAIVLLEALAADLPLVVSDIPPHLEVDLGSQSYFQRGDVAGLASVLSSPSFEHLRSPRRDEILRDNDWNTIASRHREILEGLRPRRFSTSG